MALSLRRANAVKNALVANGVSPTAISVIGKGETQLLVQTADGVREPQNRRVEIVIDKSPRLLQRAGAPGAHQRRADPVGEVGNALAQCQRHAALRHSGDGKVPHRQQDPLPTLGQIDQEKRRSEDRLCAARHSGRG